MHSFSSDCLIIHLRCKGILAVRGEDVQVTLQHQMDSDRQSSQRNMFCFLLGFLYCDYHDYARRWWSKGWQTRTTPTEPGLGKTNWEWTPWSWSGGESFFWQTIEVAISHFSRLTTFIAGTSTKLSCKKTSRRLSPISPVEQFHSATEEQVFPLPKSQCFSWE